MLSPLKYPLTDGDFVLIRHGISEYNYIAQRFTFETSYSYKSDEAKIYQLELKLVDS
jgi:hypothetical protein